MLFINKKVLKNKKLFLTLIRKERFKMRTVIFIAIFLLVAVGFTSESFAKEGGVFKPDGNWDVVGTDMYTNADVTGNVGVGTISPQSKLDINSTLAKKNTPTEEVPPGEELVEETTVEPSKDNVKLEAIREGIGTTSIEPEETFSGMSTAEVITEKPEIAEQILHEGEESIAVSETKQEDVSVKVIHKVKSNDSLFKISRKYYGDKAEWHKLYEANKDNMSGPDALYVGQELLIPDNVDVKKETLGFKTSSEKKHVIEHGDTLYHLARKYYDDSTKWHIIYEANEDTIEDKGLLVKGQILIIPKNGSSN